MWHWKMYYGYPLTESPLQDITDRIGKYITSFKVVNTLHPQNRKSKIKQSPSTLEINVTSNNYVEDLFSPGMYISLWVGQSSEKTLMTKVFQGIIPEYPDGSAQDMLNYVIKASGEIVLIAGIERKFSFLKLRNYRSIIGYLCAQEKMDPPVIDLTPSDEAKRISVNNHTTKMGKTTLEVINYFANQWNCVAWLTPPRTLNFMSAEKAHLKGDIDSKKGPYKLGYRTDALGVPNNIERIEWKHSGPSGGSETSPGFESFTENGVTVDPAQYKLVYQGKTYVMKTPYLNEVKNNPKAFLQYSEFVIQCTLAGNAYQALITYFRTLPDSESAGKKTTPVTDGSGFELTIVLNEGDPELKPPRTAKLFSGTFNTKISTAHLPNYLFAGSLTTAGQTLYINETELTYEQGMLKSTLKCSMAG